MTHTPKPWYQNENNQIFSIDGNVLIATPYFSIAMTVEEYKANVRLIAAAPEMLAALEAAQKAFQSLNVDALGFGGTERYQWSLRDELLKNIDKALALVEDKSSPTR